MGVVMANAIEGPNAIPESYFFPFGIGAAIVRNAHLENAQAHLGYFGHNLRLKSEAILLDIDALNDVAAKYFVAAFHIRQIEVGEHVREDGKEVVRQSSASSTKPGERPGTKILTPTPRLHHR